MMFDPEQITYFAETDFRSQKTKFGIKAKDRARHMYVIGKTGVGKSTLLENMAIQDVANGNGLGILDPHGSFAEKILEYIPQQRIKDVIYFAPFDTDYPISFNVLEDVGADKRHFVASGLMSTFKKIWVDAWSARMEYILNNILLALLEYPDATLLGVNRMLADKEYRKKVVENVTDPGVKSFWIEEFAKYGDRYMQEAGAAIQNKIGQFVANPLIRNIIGQAKSSFNFRSAMDEGKIIVMNLSKGRIGEQNTSLLGSMLITKIYLAAMSRADVHPTKLADLPNFYFYVDEFQSFANETFADILAEARKYKLNLIIAHQYVAQMEEKVRDAVFGNIGTTISFRVGPLDAELLEKAFSQHFTANDLVSLGMAQIYLTLMIDGMGSKPFSATTLLPIPFPQISFRNDVIEYSRKTYAVPKDEVMRNIGDWYVKEESPKEERPPRREFQQQQFEPQFRPAPQSATGTAPRQFQSRPQQGTNQTWQPRRQFQERQPQPVVQAPLRQEEESVKEHQPFKTALERMEPVVRDEAPAPVPEKAKQSLQDLLGSLDFQKKEEQPKKEIAETPIESENPFLPKLKPKSPRPLDRVATEESKAMLRSVLAKAAPSQPSASELKKEEIPAPVPQKPVSPAQNGEVPYEILKKVLE